jgi:hypothetical protein
MLVHALLLLHLLLAAANSQDCAPLSLPHPSIDLSEPRPGATVNAGPLDVTFVTTGTKQGRFGYSWSLIRDVLLVPEEGSVLRATSPQIRPAPRGLQPTPDPALVKPALLTFHFPFVYPHLNYRIVLEWKDPGDAEPCPERLFRQSFGSVSTGALPR